MVVTAFLALLSLVHICSSQDPTTTSSYDGLPSTRIGLSPFQNRRDRRTTHWEPRFNSNFDDEDTPLDRDKGAGRISYLSLSDEPSLRRQSTSLEIPVKSVIPDFDGTRTTMGGPESTFDGCFDDVVANRRSIVSLLSQLEAQQNPRNGLNQHPIGDNNDEKVNVPRCRRRIQSWSLQEPVYVEEPRWIIIEIDGQSSRGQSVHTGDPFYVARGKRSVSSHNPTKQDVTHIEPRSLSADSIASTDRDMSEKISMSTTRKKREAVNESLKKYLSLGRKAFSGFMTSESKDENHSNGVDRRNKHADLFDILHEPFFISRGKKRAPSLRRSEFSNSDYAKILETWLTKDYDTDFKDCSRNKRTNEADAESSDVVRQFRKIRGVEEDLLKENDPFYVARGKRSTISSANRRSNDNSHSSATQEITNENLTTVVSH